LRSRELTGLHNLDIKPSESDELRWMAKAVDVSDFAEYRGSENRANACDRRDWRVRLLHQDIHFCFQLIDLIIQENKLINQLFDLESEGVLGESDAERTFGNGFKLTGLVLFEPAPARLGEKCREPFRWDFR
jgi:hypothetical protein